MTITLPSVSSADVRSIVEAFRAVRWPLDDEGITAVARDLSWDVEMVRRRAIEFRTPYSLKSCTATAFMREGAAREVSVTVSDQATRTVGASAHDVARVFRSVRDDVAELLGAPAGPASGRSSNAFWDLDNRGRIWVNKLGGDVVVLYVRSEWYADLERDEERLGIDPDRDPLAE